MSSVNHLCFFVPSHFVQTPQPTQQQQHRRWFRNGPIGPFEHHVVDAIITGRRGRTIEDDPKRSVRIVIQCENAGQTKYQRQCSERRQWNVRRPEVQKIDAVETVLELITVESGARSLRGKTHYDIGKAERADVEGEIAAVVGITGPTLK